MLSDEIIPIYSEDHEKPTRIKSRVLLIVKAGDTYSSYHWALMVKVINVKNHRSPTLKVKVRSPTTYQDGRISYSTGDILRTRRLGRAWEMVST
jgi:hypothetical protein